MAVTNFTGFYYIEGDPNGYIDNAFGMNENIANYNDEDNKITFKDIVNKFTEPLTLTRNNGLVTQKFIVENFGNVGTEDDLTLISTSTNGWDKGYNIAYYIYLKANTLGQTNIENILNGTNTDDDWDSTLFTGYRANSLTLIMRADDATKIEQFTFALYPYEGSYPRTYTMYINPQAFIEKYVTLFPYTYVYYTLDDTIDRTEQQAIFSKLFQNVGRENVNNYATINIPIFSADSGELIPFHIFTKSILIPSNPLNDTYFLQAIQAAIIRDEPELTDEGLIEKYPTVFIEESRVIWPMFDNTTINNFQVQDVVSGNSLNYLSSPVTLANLNNANDNVSIFQSYDTVELITIAHRWIPLLVGGTRGALSDRIPKYRPLLEDIGTATQQDTEARLFQMWLDMVINYITGYNTISISDQTSMGLMETTQYVSFKIKSIEWRVMKRGYTTPFDTIP
jgi:hypothetical protein